MSVTVDTSSIYSAETATEELASDANGAIGYLSTHIDSSQQWVKGALMDMLLESHAEYVSAVERGLDATRTCLSSASVALRDVAKRYDLSEEDALELVRDLFKDLDGSVVSEPITGSSPRLNTSAALPSASLVEPQSVMSDSGFAVVWAILAWPDYLSISFWARQLINGAVQLISPGTFGGQDMFDYLAQQLGGDWDRVALAGDAFGNLGDYYQGLSNSVNDVGVDLFSGWSEGDGASTAGEYFAELVSAFASQRTVYEDLDQKYTNAAWTAFGACKAMISAIDALVDAVIAAVMGVESIGSAIAAVFTAGGTAPAAVVTAVIAAVEAFSAAWGIMVTAFSASIAVGAALGSATQEIEFLPLPGA
ncbi:hypothetical protein FHX48_000906 [Microbacterium halimionae]|uniref:Uncharacterized protein n=1 Tax=Microbacterium halimionae TaxID=1526413 RepID=A0A7W3JN71_9MICO|nr:hypothetical protein [Microbacterium halimionae]MBA8815854.1 hypothetical protein [Microbacterium halimionae]NII95900.1 hypothetical protein [Microbacterium halimionae]